jgi:uncharacterized membrane protein
MEPVAEDGRQAQSGSPLEAQVRELTARVYRLEETIEQLRSGRFGSSAIGATQPGDMPKPDHLESGQQVSPIHPSLTPDPHHSHFAPASRAPSSNTGSQEQARSLENRIGSQWFNRIGILALLIGMAWFLKLAIDNHWIGALGRILIGLLSGAGLIAWSERFQRKGYTAFSYSLKALGSSILYLSLWAAFSLYHLIPSGVAFAAMIVVTAFNAFLSWVQDAELLALYAIAGGLSTPLLLSAGGNHEVTLLTYLLMLDIAVLVLVVARPWSRLLFATFTGSVLLFGGWWLEYYSADELGMTATFLTCFFLIFALAPRMVRVEFGELDPDSPKYLWDNLALVVLPIANAALGFVAYYTLFHDFSREWAGALIAVSLAAFYLLLVQLPQRGILRTSAGFVSSLHLTLATLFLTIAIPLRAHGRWLTIGWLVEGGALIWLFDHRRMQLLRILAAICLGLGLGALILIEPNVAETPLLNARFGTYLVGIAVFAFVAWLEHRASLTGRTDLSHDDHLRFADRRMGAAIATLIVNILILLSVSLEIHSYWSLQRVPKAWEGRSTYDVYAQFSYSALFMTFGAVLLVAGFTRRSAFLRWQALILLAIAVGKVFLLDVSKLSQGYRILSFIGLGALLLGISFVYQRDWLHLRDSSPQKPKDSPVEKPAP